MGQSPVHAAADTPSQANNHTQYKGLLREPLEQGWAIYGPGARCGPLTSTFTKTPSMTIMMVKPTPATYTSSTITTTTTTKCNTITQVHSLLHQNLLLIPQNVYFTKLKLYLMLYKDF